jgi:hypothetical protein
MSKILSMEMDWHMPMCQSYFAAKNCFLEGCTVSIAAVAAVAAVMALLIRFTWQILRIVL